MKTMFFVFFTAICSYMNAQQNILRFEYDASGNQKKRELCFGCSGKNSQNEKEIANLQQEDMSKFYPEDNLSYYPNPVKEELFLKWKTTNDYSVSKIELFNLNGQILRSYTNLDKLETMNLPFQEQPSGVYLINILYTNGEMKTIKIVKK